MAASWNFQLPQGKGTKRVDIQSVSLREITGKDEVLAASIAEAKGKQGSIQLELVRLAIVKVDGQSVQQPFGDLDGWNSRTRKFVLDAFLSINSTSEKESEVFLSTVSEDAG
jgi:hypothetical protein